jgi:hypothetical protein
MSHAVPVGVVIVASLWGAVLHGQKPVTKLGDVRAIHLVGQSESLGSDRKIGTCLMEKMREQGPFTFPEARDDADALLTFESSIPSGAKRGLLGRSPEVKATVKALDGTVLWRGNNKYKKSTTIWGGSTDIECGLANGLVNKLVKAIEKAARNK